MLQFFSAMSDPKHHNNFSSQAALYDRYRPAYPHTVYDFIFQHLRKKEQAWDCATGNGQVAVVLADHFKSVMATDVSQQQLDHARPKANVHYLLCPAEATPFPDRSFDLITVAQAIHWFDLEKFYSEVRRTARSGALIAIMGYARVEVSPEMDPLINDFYESMFSRHFNENRRLVEQHYRTIAFPFEEIPCPLFYAKYEWTLSDLTGYLRTWSAVQRYKDETGEDPTLKIKSELEPLWKEVVAVKFPVFMRLGKIK